MAKPRTLARSATRWWYAPMRFTADTLALLRQPAAAPRERVSRRWLLQTPVGIRALNAES